jgi:hypothetical protein
MIQRTADAGVGVGPATTRLVDFVIRAAAPDHNGVSVAWDLRCAESHHRPMTMFIQFNLHKFGKPLNLRLLSR